MKTSPCARWSRFRTPKMSVYPIATREYAPPSISPLTSCWTNIVRDDTPGLTGLGPPYYRRPTDERPHEDPHISDRHGAARMDRVREGLCPRAGPRTRGAVG